MHNLSLKNTDAVISRRHLCPSHFNIDWCCRRARHALAQILKYFGYIAAHRVSRNIFFYSIKFFLAVAPQLVYADDFDAADPLNDMLSRILNLMTGPIATTIGAIALVGTGYLFLRGRIHIGRLLTIVTGLCLIYGAPHLIHLLRQSVE